jgi:hypothetical protein
MLASIAIHRPIHRRQRCSLGHRQFRAPDLEQQDGAGLVTIVPRLMLDRVVEDQRLARADIADIVTDTQTAAVGDDQRDVDIPLCGGMWVPPLRIENSAIGDLPAMNGIGALATAATVTGHAVWAAATGWPSRHK